MSPFQPNSPNDVPVAAGVQVILTADGRVHTNVHGDFIRLYGLLEFARQAVEAEQRKARSPAAIEVAPPSAVRLLNGKQ